MKYAGRPDILRISNRSPLSLIQLETLFMQRISRENLLRQPCNHPTEPGTRLTPLHSTWLAGRSAWFRAARKVCGGKEELAGLGGEGRAVAVRDSRASINSCNRDDVKYSV